MDIIPKLPRIQIKNLRIHNFRCLQEVEIKNLGSINIFTGESGSGASTFFDVLSFLQECFLEGLPYAWRKQEYAKYLMSYGQSGPVEIEITYTQAENPAFFTYTLTITEERGRPCIVKESLYEGESCLMEYRKGEVIISPKNARYRGSLVSHDILAVKALGEFDDMIQARILKDFMENIHISELSPEIRRNLIPVGCNRTLFRTGENLPNVIQHLQEKNIPALETVYSSLKPEYPFFQNIQLDIGWDGQLRMLIKESCFDSPLPAKFTSPSLLKRIAYAILLNVPQEISLLGLEYPEEHFSSAIVSRIANDCKLAAESMQIFILTNSPIFVKEIPSTTSWSFVRDKSGFTQVLNNSIATEIEK